MPYPTVLHTKAFDGLHLSLCREEREYAGALQRQVAEIKAREEEVWCLYLLTLMVACLTVCLC